MLTYTFNYCVKGEIRKKTWLNKITCYNNKLAPKFRNFCSNILQTSAFVVERHKSEHFSAASKLIFNKTCEVSLNTILFFEKMNKIEGKKSVLYKTVFSTNSLLAAHDQLKSKFNTVTLDQKHETPKSLNLNAIEPIFEGSSKWKSITKLEYDFIKKSNNNITVVKNKSGYFKKDWVIPSVFSRFSFGYRPSRSLHAALNPIKNWPTSLSWFIKFDVAKVFDTVNKNRLKNIFLMYCPEHCI